MRIDDMAGYDSLVQQFEAGTIPPSEWTHHAHLAVGAWHVNRYGKAEALDRLRAGIQRLNEKHGTPNSLTRGYHETITRAYVELLVQSLQHCHPELPFQERVNYLLASSLARKNVLFRFYSREVLFSPRAKTEWVEPDIAPLELDPGFLKEVNLTSQ
ncbi:MAG: hypothetical protein U0V70_10060 [Terriglobia bacterium]